MCMASPSPLLCYETFSLLYKGLVIIVGHAGSICVNGRLPRPLQTSQGFCRGKGLVLADTDVPKTVVIYEKHMRESEPGMKGALHVLAHSYS